MKQEEIINQIGILISAIDPLFRAGQMNEVNEISQKIVKLMRNLPD